jgi:hypothetical protein
LNFPPVDDGNSNGHMVSIFKNKIHCFRTQDRDQLKVLIEGIPPTKTNASKGKRKNPHKTVLPSYNVFYCNGERMTEGEMQQTIVRLIPEQDPFRFAHLMDAKVNGTVFQICHS